MARALNKLSAMKVMRLKKQGRYADGGGLYLQVGPTGGKSWLFRYTREGKSREMGLGALDVVTIPEAREKALEARRTLAAGKDPLDEREAEKARMKLAQSKGLTFSQCATAYIESHKAGWRNEKHAGFVFKVQANMDPNHRDRIAFFRLCSGRFRRGMKLRHCRTGKTFSVPNPIFFFAQERELAEEALPGDIIGVPNHGSLRVGDALTEGENLRFTGIPNFAPEILRRVRLDEPMRAKQLRRALEDLAEEGVTQIFRPILGSNWIVGVVGQLQLDVLASRIASEYKIAVGFESASYETARWLASDDPAVVKRFIERNRGAMAEDVDDSPVFLARNNWELNHTIKEWPDLRFLTTRERA
jgi:peptide subunit release factor RF-3